VSRERNEVFSAFYAEHWAAVAGYCAGLVRSGHLGDELAQEAFTRLYLRWGRAKDPLAYTYRIAHNLAFDHRRSAARERQQLVEPVAEGTDHALLDAVRRLPRPLRDVTLLHYYADLPLAQVAQALRRPLGTVKRQLHEARQLLAETLKEVP
jgi:RNA polymerase sigma-70 factor (ECF subfamily)